MFQYTNNAMVISGQVFFPILFALMVIYLSWRNSEATQRFRGPHLLILGLSVISLLVTIAGVIATIWYLYPSVYVYYSSFLILIVELALVIAALPKKEKKERKVSTRQQRRKRGTNLVATAKNPQPKD
ncbi:MAG: hypothetical protein Q3974_01235 [Rothia sp. (in: high G+C Gram-positive bacteria)]|nr:hypothetical protein [Rothia sp. (in: high G+C Gram-positive bacteria)]